MRPLLQLIALAEALAFLNPAAGFAAGDRFSHNALAPAEAVAFHPANGFLPMQETLSEAARGQWISNGHRRRLGWLALGIAAGAVVAAAAFTYQINRQSADAPDAVQRLHPLIKWYYNRYRADADPFVDVKGLNGKRGIFALNHGYKSGVDGFLFAFMLAHRTGRVPKVLITGSQRTIAVRLRRWMLERAGVALIVPDEASPARANGSGDSSHAVTEAMTAALRAGYDVVIFPAGEAVADPEGQLEHWSRSIAYAAQDSGTSIHPVAAGGIPFDWTEEDVLEAGRAARERGTHPLRFYFRIGEPVVPVAGETQAEIRDRVVARVLTEMREIPGLLRTNPLNPLEGRQRLSDGRTLAYLDRGSKRPDTMVLFYFHGLQGSRWEGVPGLDALLERLNIRWIAVDRPGIGASTPRLGVDSLSRFPKDVQELANALIPGGVYSILGNSAGTAFALACHELERVGAIGIVSLVRINRFWNGFRNFARHEQEQLLAARLLSRRFQEAAKMTLAEFANDPEAHFAKTLAHLSEDDRRILQDPAMKAQFMLNRQEGYANGPRYIWKDLRALMSPLRVFPDNFWPDLLIWHGIKDRLVSPAVARWWHQAIPRSRLHLLPGRGHYFILEEIESILTEIRDAHRLRERRFARAAA
jgi:pimeloyl-ACP methyl ester carboxylesterase